MISGVFDLKLLPRTDINDKLNLDRTTAAALSPLLKALEAVGARFVQLSEFPLMDHFNVVDELYTSNSEITQRSL
uniref:Uncharacterized protein n=1 Tax=Strigamia maritima TaxID=126957 RepID=T1IWI7_STRMM